MKDKGRWSKNGKRGSGTCERRREVGVASEEPYSTDSPQKSLSAFAELPSQTRPLSIFRGQQSPCSSVLSGLSPGLGTSSPGEAWPGVNTGTN